MTGMEEFTPPSSVTAAGRPAERQRRILSRPATESQTSSTTPPSGAWSLPEDKIQGELKKLRAEFESSKKEEEEAKAAKKKEEDEEQERRLKEEEEKKKSCVIS